ncbi:MAG: adenosylcobalamin-dependent ribonucleoside-diphosphate reductase [Kofleriaceae bacterium]|nr:adenosylcobalamin-dependent ribonucleoside-diphosphate reductase [Kofleriaceae bacterium]MBP6836838.1 adenosylcobalamin-dependent ribonucleoside-diphosphate reductase [Kofleriaceae bacterium]MBP9205730.1 adenosylcobalamin-dependent ribonucleoside-diphosphate reductase [Kofleriaceae bacterium]
MARALGDNALTVLRRRYLAPLEGGGQETPAQLFARVAHAVAASEARHGAGPAEVTRWTDRFTQRMSDLEFLPNSPTLMNAGRPLGQLAACFVVPVADHLDEVFAAVGWAARIQKTGGGTGFSFSRLRPAGDRVASTGGVAAGPVALMQVFDAATEAIRQGGTRRGANMGVLRVDHPDILEFVALKLGAERMRNFNLSVGVTDAFMTALAADASYPLVNPRDGAVTRTLRARVVWDAMVRTAWAVGDPGVVFLDRINAAQPTPDLGGIEATNPCGEQPLLPFESCTLGSLVLSRFVRAGTLDRAALAEAVHDAVRFLDDVLDANSYPLEQIARATLATRKIGLGVMGWADLLVDLDLPYDSEPALILAEEVATLIERESVAASSQLAAERGVFPAWPGSTWARAGIRMRNATTTTIAPTGTISIIAGCSSGIEPLFALAYDRHVLDGAVLRELHPRLRELALEAAAFTPAMVAAVERTGHLRGLDPALGVPAALARRFPTAHEIAVPWHVRTQAAFQRGSHAAVSKTINLPAEASPDEVGAAYQLAYDLGCKGITVYRDGSRAGQVLTAGHHEQDQEAEQDTCPDCGGPLRGTRCRLCARCGFSSCAL